MAFPLKYNFRKVIIRVIFYKRKVEFTCVRKYDKCE